jgi:ABC-type lipoprotein release transport system permease subunit
MRVLLQIAFRNLFASFLNIVIGAIILVGTLAFVVGGSVLNSVDSSMSKSIIGSIAGHVQIYSDASKDDLAIYDNWNTPDLAAMPDFAKIKPLVEAIPNVKTVIPEGVSGASLTYGNTMDQALEKLRKSVDRREKGDHSPELALKIGSLKDHVRQMLGVIQGDYKKLAVLAAKEAIDQESVAALTKAASPEFWESFDRNPFEHLEFLENKISGLIPDADMIFFGYVGTDLDKFQQSFDRMQIVDGQMVPSGHRGLMLAKYVYEDQFKIKSARRLDKINEALFEQNKKIAQDPDLQLMIKQNKTQTREIILQLDPITSLEVQTGLTSYLHSDEKDLAKLLAAFFDTDDVNFKERYDYFYKEIAPKIELYRVRPGDMMTIKAFTKSGFVQSSNVKVYGTFQFKGLEKSGLAGGMSLMDLMTFRDLYGYVTPEKLEESKRLKLTSGVKQVDKANAEAELFGGTSVVSQVKEKKIDDQKELGGVKYNAESQSLLDRTYTQDEIEHGVAINAAVILKDPSQITSTMHEIEEVSKKNGLNLRVVTWQKAAGNLGQFVFVAKAVLYFAIFIIFIVALVIINNAIMMATLQRVREIGTMRAIGAQRGFVLALVLVETLLLGLSFGSVGTAAGSGIVKWLGVHGIPAGNEFLYFFYSGPRLYVTLGWGSVIGAMVIICIVTCISALYPAIVATRISPIQAMGAED